DSLRDLIPATVRRLTGRGPRPDELADGDFWAVRDLSFEVQPGQTLGIIGPNGSGKSTTLKLLTRIHEPTRGYCELRGRVGTLIEVAAGFHGDLTGRENVFLQGAIMGMRTKDIERKFDEIVEFSGIPEFIDTPVKRYSSGMNARLGFSIAAHLEPDVLIIDEVLAVGDLAFQERAFGRIRDLAQSGIPVVIVSHQMERIAELCTNAILLRKGEVVARGTASEVISAYVRQNALPQPASATAGPIAFSHTELLDDEIVQSGDRVHFRIDGVVTDVIPANLDPFTIRVRSLKTGTMVYTTGARQNSMELARGPFSIRLSLQANLPVGDFLIEIAAVNQISLQDESSGPSVMIRVVDANTFRGWIQLNATMEVVTS
ncbi:MAG: ABC transporter ATP-binding protein, partial [Phycisphaerae bacterium]|nr:ABC transporter ATP-binding protein [Gemmatimonadaceae bacterium]